jgi:hypothetical protein
MGRTTRTDVATCPRFGRGARHGRSEPSASGALASRRSTAALAVVSRPRLFDFRPGFLGRGRLRALPALACPSPAAAPRAPAVIPADMMPEAARERFARPPAGTALAPLSGSHLESALAERGGGGVSGDGDEGQARSANFFMRFSKPLKSNLFGVKYLPSNMPCILSIQSNRGGAAKIRKRSSRVMAGRQARSAVFAYNVPAIHVFCFAVK